VEGRGWPANGKIGRGRVEGFDDFVFTRVRFSTTPGVRDALGMGGRTDGRDRTRVGDEANWKGQKKNGGAEVVSCAGWAGEMVWSIGRGRGPW
jgi:hypothetical protein